MNDVIQTIERELMPEFKAVAARLATSFPLINISTGADFAGSPESRAYWGMYISCFFRNATPEQLDLVDLCLEIGNLQGTPTINADICWGHPSGQIERSFCEDWKTPSDWPKASPERIEELRVFLPGLFAKLEEILSAGPQPIKGGG